MWAWWLNTAWMLKCAGERLRFARACRRPSETQAEVLRQIVRANRDTWFGRLHSFARITDPRSFQTHVPPATHDDFAPMITRVAAGEERVLTSERVLLLEPTSGTTGGEKLIPYTAGLRRQFQRGVSAWIADLFYHRPQVRSGRAYWSISPALSARRVSPGGIPIGFEDDAAYLGRFEQFALRKLLVVPRRADVEHSDVLGFRLATLGHLLAAEDLALISVWSPTFLTALLSLLVDPDAQLATVENALAKVHGNAVTGARLENLRSIWASSMSLPEKIRQTWPRLALISCWTDAAAGQFVPEVRRMFPDVEIQPKGLLATEGFVSLPIQAGSALALRCHFFEFEESGSGRIRLAHELDLGGRYNVLITTAGGLYRYRLNDMIEVAGFHHRGPLLRFLGKCDMVCDLVGEKLAEEHVRSVMGRMSSTFNFCLLVPVLDQPPRYRLYVQGSVSLQTIAAELQAGLEENPYYRHAVAIGQLAAVEVVLLDNRASAWAIYERRGLERGQKCGDIKPVLLDRWTGWPERFAPLVRAVARADTPAHNLPSQAAPP